MRLGRLLRGAAAEVVAVKRIPKDAVRTVDALRNIKHEVTVMRLLRNARARALPEGSGAAAVAAAEGLAHVAALVDVRISAKSVHIVQIAGGCNLHKLSQIGGPLSALVLAPVARGLAAALVAVHAIGWCHRDVKPENVLLGVNSRALEMLARTDPRRAAANVHVQLCDFGIASPLPREDEPRLRQLCGSPGFFAPEVRATPGRLPRARTSNCARAGS